MRLLLLPISTRRAVLCTLREKSASPPAKASLIDRATNKANAVWSQWEHADASWKKKIVSWGDAAFARIPYQEWSLKGIPRRDATAASGKEEPVKAWYPAALMNPAQAMESIEELAYKRVAFHRRRMWWSLAGMPFTAPVALIPIIPNFPFFYLVFRAWSHWKAISGANHLEYIIRYKRLDISPSSTLDRVYAIPDLPEERLQEVIRKAQSYPSCKQRRGSVRSYGRFDAAKSPVRTKETHREDERIVSTKQTGALVALCFENQPQIEVEMERALAQVRRTLEQKKDGQDTVKPGDNRSGEDEK